LEEEPIERDAQGRELVKLSIPTSAYDRGGIRALNQTIAQSAWDYVEVVFQNGTEYYAGAAIKGNAINLALPAATYNAVMFAGLANGTKLLAVGVPTATSVGSIPTTITPAIGAVTIALDTTGIEFTLSALTMGIGNIEINNAGSAGVVDVNGYKQVPYFLLAKGVSVSTDTSITIAGFGDGTDGVPNGSILATSATLFGVAGTPTITSTGVFASDAATQQTFSPVSASAITVDAAAITSGSLKVEFSFTTPTTDGFTKLRLDIPIQAFNDGSTSASIGGQGHVWHIVTGIDDTALDTGTNSLGQNILLAIGSSPTNKTITTSGF
jgi:hypothetical protein